MRFGLLYEIEGATSRQADPLRDGFTEALEQAKVAEAAGFDSVWSVEHLSLPPSSVASAPEVWLAAVAQHTERIRIGHGVRLVPFEYNSPIRVAETAAVLDIVSGGRLELGTARPPSEAELEGRGLDPAETRARWDEALRMIPRMWIEDEFGWSSEHFEMPPRSVLPKPVQQPHPPLWTSGVGADAAARAGERGLGFIDLSMSDPAGLDVEVRRHREAVRRAEPVGAAVNARFATCAALFCGRDDADAAARAGDAVCRYARLAEAVYASRAGPHADASRARDGEQREDEGVQELGLAELVDRRRAIVGSPERCIESIEWYRSQGVDELLFGVQMGSLGHDDVCESLRRFGDEVIPHFHPHRRPRLRA